MRQRFVVAAPTTGRLLRIDLDEGDPVEAGSVVARIVPSPLDARDEAGAQARLEAAEAQQRAVDARRALSEAALAQARRDAERAALLQKGGTISTETHEKVRLAQTRAEEEARAARFAVDAAEHEVQAARAALMTVRAPAPANGAPQGPCSHPGAPCFEIRAPVAGEVLRVLEESERIVLAGTPLLELGDPADLELVADILSSDAVKVRSGAEIIVEDWGGDTPLRARVRRVEPSGFTKVSALGVEEQRVNVLGDFVGGAGGLGDGFRVEVRIVVWEAPEVVRVPGSALFRRGDSWSVFVAEGGRARSRDVEIGQRSSLDTEVRSGLTPGDLVILHPSDRIHDTARIRPL